MYFRIPKSCARWAAAAPAAHVGAEWRRSYAELSTASVDEQLRLATVQAESLMWHARINLLSASEVAHQVLQASEVATGATWAKEVLRVRAERADELLSGSRFARGGA